MWKAMTSSISVIQHVSYTHVFCCNFPIFSYDHLEFTRGTLDSELGLQQQQQVLDRQVEAECAAVNRLLDPGEARSREEAWLQRQPTQLITFSISTRMEDPFLCY